MSRTKTRTTASGSSKPAPKICKEPQSKIKCKQHTTLNQCMMYDVEENGKGDKAKKDVDIEDVESEKAFGSYSEAEPVLFEVCIRVNGTKRHVKIFTQRKHAIFKKLGETLCAHIDEHHLTKRQALEYVNSVRLNSERSLSGQTSSGAAM